MKVIVTGHAGFIGKHLVKHLRDVEVVGIDRSTSNDDAVKSIRLDLSEMDERKLEPHSDYLQGADAVVHIAAYRPVVGSRRGDSFDENTRTNVTGTLNVLTMAKTFKIDKVIFASTKSVYGNPKGLIKEEGPARPETNYGKSKLLAEGLCREFGEAYGLSCTSLRIASVFGPGMACNLVFAKFLNNALKGRDLVVHEHLSGYEYLDLIYVKDVTEAIQRSLHLRHDCVYEALNIGGKSPVSTLSLASEIVKATGSKSEIDTVRTQEMRHGFKLSTEKASKVLGWTPKYDIASAVKDLLPSWYCEHIR
ncbi:MAG: NAD(P)-dependent oxidoreductase [Aigarchaeota archaeon]|nr:NAD(P)-dependent oxidoreductase [Aigarchaeota archaeon]